MMDSQRSSKSLATMMINMNSLVDDLTCSVCLEIYSDPRILDCHHSFCKKCLIRKRIKTQDFYNMLNHMLSFFVDLIKDHKICCPKCRKLTESETADRVPKNNLVANLVSNFTSSKASCPECKIINELLVCQHCSQIFCEICFEVLVF